MMTSGHQRDSRQRRDNHGRWHPLRVLHTRNVCLARTMTTRFINKAILAFAMGAVLAHIALSRSQQRPRFLALATYGGGGGGSGGGSGGGGSSGSGAGGKSGSGSGSSSGGSYGASGGGSSGGGSYGGSGGGSSSGGSYGGSGGGSSGRGSYGGGSSGGSSGGRSSSGSNGGSQSSSYGGSSGGSGSGSSTSNGGSMSASASGQKKTDVTHLDKQKQDVCNQLKETVKTKKKECEDMEKTGKKDTPEYNQKKDEIAQCKNNIQSVAGSDLDVDKFCGDGSDNGGSSNGSSS